MLIADGQSLAARYVALSGVDGARLVRDLSPALRAVAARQAALADGDASRLVRNLSPALRGLAAYQAAAVANMDTAQLQHGLDPLIKRLGRLAQSGILGGTSVVDPGLRDAARKAWAAAAPEAVDDETYSLPAAPAVENAEAIWSRLHSAVPEFTTSVDASLDPVFTPAQRRWVRGVILTMLVMVYMAAPALAVLAGNPLAAAISALVGLLTDPKANTDHLMGWIEDENDDA